MANTPNIAVFLDEISCQVSNGTQYAFASSGAAFAVVRELLFRIDKIRKVGVVPGADEYFARCAGNSCVVTNVPLAVVDSVVRRFLSVGASLQEQAEAMANV